MNNPSRYTDPTGHCVLDYYWSGGCHTESAFLDHFLAGYGVKTDHASKAQKWDAAIGVGLVGNKLATTIGNGISPEDAFKKVMGPLTIEIGGDFAPTDGCKTYDGLIACHNITTFQTIIHELGHEFDIQYKNRNTVGDQHFASDYLPGSWIASSDGFMCTSYPCEEHPASDTTLPYPDSREQFADMFLNWTLDGIAAHPTGIPDGTSLYPQNGFNASSAGKNWSDWMNGTSTYYTGVGMPVFLQAMGY